MTVIIHKNFLSKDECDLLNVVAIKGVEEGWVNKGIQRQDTNYNLRYTSRMHMQDVEYPQIVRDISDKVRKFMGLDEYSLINGHGKDGVVVSVTFQNGEVYEHFDPPGGHDTVTYRCNVLTQANEEGADLYVNKQKIDIGVGDLHCYAVSELPHYVTEAKGPTPRIMWMFGAHVPLKDLKQKGML